MSAPTSSLAHLRLLASYNAWMNARVYDAAAKLPMQELAALRAHRDRLDATITEWISGLTDSDLQHVLHYANTRGVPAKRHFGTLLIHFFNHQTHHRGQASTLLMQAGEDVGVTDLLALIPEAAG